MTAWKKVLITGVAGFLGSHLAEAITASGRAVIGIDNLSTGRMDNLRGMFDRPNFTFWQCDVGREQVMQLEGLEDVTEIYHLASPASPAAYQADPFGTIAVNTLGTRHMLELARKTGAKLVYASTSEAYGDPEVHPQPENYRGNVNTWGPRACYDEAKRLGEVFCYEYWRQFRLPVKVARIFNTYSAGLRNDDGRVMSNFVTQALSGKHITVYGDGLQTRSFCYVDDTVEGLRLLMDRDAANGEIVNIGSEQEYSIWQVANLIKALANSESPITFHPLPEDDPKVRRPALRKAKELLGWEPAVDLETGLLRMIEAYRALIAK